MPLADTIIGEYQALITELDEAIDPQEDNDAKQAIRSLSRTLRTAMTYLALISCKELEEIKIIRYQTKAGTFLQIPFDRPSMERSIRRSVLLEAWTIFEIYASRKVPDAESFSTGAMIQKYFDPDPVPESITFFRETRNCFHGNGTYNPRKGELIYTMQGSDYRLIPGEEAKFMDHSFILGIIKEVAQAFALTKSE